MAKTKSVSKKAVKRGKRPRIMALAASERKLRARRYPAAHRNGMGRKAINSSPARMPAAEASMLSWSPWHLMLRQQAIMARGLAFFLEAQGKIIENWTSLSRAATQAPRR
jgi:hypothetical protein